MDARRLVLLLAAILCVLSAIVASVSSVVAQEAKPMDAKVIRGVSYVGLAVSDVDQSAAFYGEAARLEEVARDRLEKSAALDVLAGREGVAVESVLLASTNAQTRLMKFDDVSESSVPGPVPVNGPGVAHVCYQSDGKLETYQKFIAAGAKTRGNPELVVLSPRNPVVYAYAHDPDGIMFEVEHIDVAAAETAREGFYRIRHVSLASPDIDRAVAFYSKLLETPSPRRAGGENGLAGEPFDQVSGLPGTRLLMAWFSVRNLELEIVEYLSHPPEPAAPRPVDAPGYNMIVFDTWNLDAAKKLLVEAGGTVETGPEPMDGGTILFGRDPDGNILGFLATEPDSVMSSSRFAKP